MVGGRMGERPLDGDFLDISWFHLRQKLPFIKGREMTSLGKEQEASRKIYLH